MAEQNAGTSLPAPDQVSRGPLAFDVRELAEPLPPIVAKRPPAGAPNVLMVLLDDVGFGASSAFGGPVHTPTAERLANQGLRYSRFHTTALCSPTRAALLSGRNHHQVGMGHITETATPSPGYRSTRPNSTTPLAEILRQSGYNTAQFGKCHEVPVWESGPTGPFDHWPINSGFDTHQVRAEFAYAGGGIGRGGQVALYVDGEAAGSGEVKRTHPLYFSFDEGMDVGVDTAMPVCEGCANPRGRFSGTVHWAQINLGDDDHNHLIPPEAHLQAALTHQ